MNDWKMKNKNDNNYEVLNRKLVRCSVAHISLAVFFFSCSVKHRVGEINVFQTFLLSQSFSIGHNNQKSLNDRQHTVAQKTEFDKRATLRRKKITRILLDEKNNNNNNKKSADCAVYRVRLIRSLRRLNLSIFVRDLFYCVIFFSVFLFFTVAVVLVVINAFFSLILLRIFFFRMF